MSWKTYIYIGVNCSPEEISIYTSLFKEFRDVFAWSYEEMPGIDPSIVEHEIRTYPDAKHAEPNVAHEELGSHKTKWFSRITRFIKNQLEFT